MANFGTGYSCEGERVVAYPVDPAVQAVHTFEVAPHEDEPWQTKPEVQTGATVVQTLSVDVDKNGESDTVRLYSDGRREADLYHTVYQHQPNHGDTDDMVDVPVRAYWKTVPVVRL
jgi:hypothetical protein